MAVKVIVSAELLCFTKILWLRGGGISDATGRLGCGAEDTGPIRPLCVCIGKVGKVSL